MRTKVGMGATSNGIKLLTLEKVLYIPKLLKFLTSGNCGELVMGVRTGLI